MERSGPDSPDVDVKCQLSRYYSEQEYVQRGKKGELDKLQQLTPKCTFDLFRRSNDDRRRRKKNLYDDTVLCSRAALQCLIRHLLRTHWRIDGGIQGSERQKDVVIIFSQHSSYRT
ncbi:hypothetical protein F2P81_022566 [Scophthalmus maximus]|uniref:Uncharacterized protein n=1 Tax=Scophthalmus maximus TaxID=52904 RepID=A0A6A4S0C4_SCOMX|nr:hypothetical protein F2P81_022566 [Scophthalmus maximus]